MQLPIYIFSAKQGMQWLSGASADVVRLDAIRKRIGKLADFDAGEAPYRGILADNEKCYVYACFLAPRFDFRGRDATYFIFTEIPNVYWNTFNFDALLHSELFTKPCMQINDSMTFDGDRFIKPFALNTTQQDFIGANHWLTQLPDNTEIRFHQEGPLTAPIAYSKQILSTAPSEYSIYPQEPKHCIEHEASTSQLLKATIEELQTGNKQLQYQYAAVTKMNASQEQHIHKLVSTNKQLTVKCRQLTAENSRLKQQLSAVQYRDRILQLVIVALLIGIAILMGITLCRYFPKLTQLNKPVVGEELTDALEDLFNE